MFTQTNPLTAQPLFIAFMVPELIIEWLSIASAAIDELKTVNLQKYVKNLKCANIKKDLVSTHSLKPFLLITQDLSKIKNIQSTLF